MIASRLLLVSVGVGFAASSLGEVALGDVALGGVFDGWDGPGAVHAANDNNAAALTTIAAALQMRFVTIPIPTL